MRDGPSLNGLPIVPGTKLIGTYIQNSPVATHDIVVTLNERKGDVWHGVFESLRATQANGGGVTNTGFKYACELTNKSPTTTTLRMTAITGNTSGNTIRDTTSNWLEELTWDGKSLSNAPMKLTPVK